MLEVEKLVHIGRRTVHIEKIVIDMLELKDHRATSALEDGTLIVRFEVQEKPESALWDIQSTCPPSRPSAGTHLETYSWLEYARLLCHRPWRVRCPHCGIRRERLPWAIGKARPTRALIVSLATWAKLLQIETVVGLFGVPWSTVYSAVTQAVKYGLDRRQIGTVLPIGMDEISRKKGNTYLTQVYDLNTRTLLWSGKDRTDNTLRSFFDAYPELAEPVTAVCCDMWETYAKVFGECLPSAEIVFDKFHLIRDLLDSVNSVRSQAARALKKTHQNLLPRTRYVLLKNKENLTDKQQLKLRDLQRMNLKSTLAWLLKEAFREFRESPDYEEAVWFLKQWCWMAAHSKLNLIKKVVKMIRRHWNGILAYFRHRITNGVIEALNNTAKAISHRARGYRTIHVFTHAMLLCMGRLEMPSFHHEFS
jgi:transposase